MNFPCLFEVIASRIIRSAVLRTQLTIEGMYQRRTRCLMVVFFRKRPSFIAHLNVCRNYRRSDPRGWYDALRSNLKIKKATRYGTRTRGALRNNSRRTM